MRRPWLLGTAAAALLLSHSAGAAVVVSDADVAADPQIFVQQSGTAPAGGDPNIITNAGGFVVGVAGNFTLQDPLLVVVANYNGGTSSISFSGCATPSACPAAVVGTYGLTANTATFDATTGGSAFAALGLTAGGSENFGNFSAADIAEGFAAPDSFFLQVFQLAVNLVSGAPITIDTTAVDGSFILAYGCEDGTGSSSGCHTNGNIGQTVFTNTGLVDDRPASPVPEPTSLLIFGAGLLGLGLMRKRSMR